MRVVIVTQDETLYTLEFFRTFFSAWKPSRPEIVSLVLLNPQGRGGKARFFRRILAFYGPAGMMRLGFRYLAAKMRGRLRPAQRLAGLASARGIPVLRLADINAVESVGQLARLSPDLVVSVSAPQIFAEGVLAVPKWGSINIHDGKLPRYRGMLPVFWQMLHRESFITITIHRMSLQIDEGEILVEKQVPVDEEKNLHRMILKTKQEAARTLLHLLTHYRPEDSGKPMESGGRGYFSFPRREHALQFYRSGGSLL